MTRFDIRFSLSLILLCLCAINPMHAQEDGDYAVYNYAFRLIEEGQTQILYIDPLNPTADLTAFTKDPFPSGPRMRPVPQGIAEHLVSGERISPDGKWALIERRDEATNEVLFDLWQLETGRMQNIYNNGIEATEIYSMAWSPDSQFVAYSFYWPDMTGHLLLELYSLKDDEKTTLFEDGRWQHHTHNLIWSADSHNLVLANWGCLERENCYNTDFFQVFSILPEKSLIASVQTGPLIASPTCGHVWSPDNRYIAFMSYCDSSPFLFRDVYLFDTQLKEFSQVTHLANPYPMTDDATSDDLIPFMNSYGLHWTDAETLLIGYRKLAGGTVFRMDQFEQKTVLYHTADRTTTALFDDDLYFASSPTDDRFAYRDGTSTLVATSDDPTEGNLVSTFEGIHIARLEGQTLLNLYTGPYGCGLSWSPDGRFLAYATDDAHDGRCSRPTGYIFIDTKTNTRTLFTSPEGEYLTPVGWLPGAGLG